MIMYGYHLNLRGWVMLCSYHNKIKIYIKKQLLVHFDNKENLNLLYFISCLFVCFSLPINVIFLVLNPVQVPHYIKSSCLPNLFCLVTVFQFSCFFFFLALTFPKGAGEVYCRMLSNVDLPDDFLTLVEGKNITEVKFFSSHHTRE